MEKEKPKTSSIGDMHELNTKLRMVELARDLAGDRAAIDLWRRLELPDLLATETPAAAKLESARLFLDECCAFDPVARVQARRLFEAFSRWEKAQGAPFATTETSFGTALRRLGVEKRRGQHVIYSGLRLKHPNE